MVNMIAAVVNEYWMYWMWNVGPVQVTPYFYKIPMGKKNGEDVSGLEAELKEKLSKLNEVNFHYHRS